MENLSSYHRIGIIGGGIGGLTTAIALQQSGLKATVFESVPHIKPVGAGILLAGNAGQVYQQLGLFGQLSARGTAIEELQLTDTSLQPFRRGVREEDLPGFPSTLGIHRGALQEELIQSLEPDSLQLGKRLRFLKEEDAGLRLIFEDGTEQEVDLLIGADGIHSVVRDLMGWDRGLRDARQACWRGVVPLLKKDGVQPVFREAWGANVRFGFGPIGEGQLYWFLVAGYDRVGKDDLAQEELAGLVAGFHPLVSSLLLRTDEQAILRNDLFDLHPPVQWHSRRVVLLGDAAHATTPNMGQGACQSIEDAWVLANCLLRQPNVSGLEQYEELRRKKALGVIRQSWRIGQMAHWSSRPARFLRNSLMRSLPKSQMIRHLRALYSIPEFSPVTSGGAGSQLTV
jgi:2-polyprenyl-6-methoxyphenol hydroxylase-like FAD-dependent oxidoreductase